MKKVVQSVTHVDIRSVKMKTKTLGSDEFKVFSVSDRGVLLPVSPIRSVTTPPSTVLVELKKKNLGSTTFAEMKLYRLSSNDHFNKGVLFDVYTYKIQINGLVEGPIKDFDHKYIYRPETFKEFIKKLNRMNDFFKTLDNKI